METITFADVVARGFSWGVSSESIPVPPGTHCSLTGVSISRGYHGRDIIANTIGDPMDFANGAVINGYLSSAAAAVISNSRNVGSVFALEGVAAVRPLVSKEAAIKSDRPCWADILKTLPTHTGKRCVCIIATDFKKRVIHNAQLATVGTRTPIYMLDRSTNANANYVVDVVSLSEIIQHIETLYTQGFTRRAIENSLLLDGAVTAENIALERELIKLRQHNEFKIALVVARREP